MIIKHCPRCGTYHQKSGTYCSRSCANSRVFSEESRKKKSISGKKYWQGLSEDDKRKKIDRMPQNAKKLEKWEYVECPTCNTWFETLRSQPKVFCSKECIRRGGYRPGSGRSRSGYYQGIYCGSTYELVWLIYQIDNRRPFKRFSRQLVCPNTGRRYLPDFEQDGILIEIKGYEDPKEVSEKCKIAESNGYKVLVKRKEDLKEEFDWVHTYYVFKNIWELYDDYAPIYNLECNNCGKSFTRDHKTTKETSFCDRRCAMIYNRRFRKKSMHQYTNG